MTSLHLDTRILHRGPHAAHADHEEFEFGGPTLEPLLDGVDVREGVQHVSNNFLLKVVSIFRVQHCPAVLAIVGHSRARLIHASGTTTLSERHPTVNLVDGDALEIHSFQQAQRGFIRNAAAFWIACFAVGYFIAAVVHIVTDRSAQW